MIRVLYIGDVVGQPGRRALHQKLEPVTDREKVDFTIVNVENAAGGFGVTEAIMEELSELPINAYTSGCSSPSTIPAGKSRSYSLRWDRRCLDICGSSRVTFRVCSRRLESLRRSL